MIYSTTKEADMPALSQTCDGRLFQIALADRLEAEGYVIRAQTMTFGIGSGRDTQYGLRAERRIAS
jgi:hypothetical protein